MVCPIDFCLQNKTQTIKQQKAASSQNTNNLYSEGKKEPTHSTFMQKISFCPVYGWVIVSVGSTGPSRRGGSGGGIYCNGPWSLAPHFVFACRSVSGKNKPSSLTPVSTEAPTCCAVTPLPGSDAGLNQLAPCAGPFLKRKSDFLNLACRRLCTISTELF